MDFYNSEKNALIQTMKDMSIKITSSDHQKYREISQLLWEKFEKGLINSASLQRKRFELFAEYLHIDIAKAPLINERYVRNLSHQVIMQSGALEMVQKLKRWYKIAVITNGLYKVQRERLKRSGLQQMLDGVFISQEMGVRKPCKEFFMMVMDAFYDHDRDKYLIIGDSITADISGGINAGMDTCWYNPTHKKVQDIEFSATYNIDGFDDLMALLLG